LTQVVFDGEYVPGNQWVNPEHPYFQESLPIPKRDVAKAKALLKEAGINGPVAIDLMVPQGPAAQAVAEVIQAMVSEVGFDIKIRITEFATSLKEAEAGEYQAFLIAWSGRIDPDGNLYVFNACKAPQNTSGYCDKEVDKLLDEARTISAPAERKEIYEKVAKTLLDEGPILYLFHRRVLIAHTVRLEGYRPMPDGLVRVVGLRLK
jgi:peptide/nickel transport system substrate-binding protein